MSLGPGELSGGPSPSGWPAQPGPSVFYSFLHNLLFSTDFYRQFSTVFYISAVFYGFLPSAFYRFLHICWTVLCSLPRLPPGPISFVSLPPGPSL